MVVQDVRWPHLLISHDRGMVPTLSLEGDPPHPVLKRCSTIWYLDELQMPPFLACSSSFSTIVECQQPPRSSRMPVRGLKDLVCQR